jgi:uncharacterized membrane protein YbhN (UPF0104 family)
MKRTLRILRALSRPRVFVTLALSAGLLVALFSLANLGAAITLMARFRRRDLVYFLLLMLGYEVVRGAQWSYCLRQLRLRIPLRIQVFAFALSEVTKALPVGNYFQNYILKLNNAADCSRSSVATSLIVVEEVVVCVAGVAILGLGAWTLWARAAILTGAALVAGLILLSLRLYHKRTQPAWVARSPRLRQLADGLGEFREGARDMLRPRPLAMTLCFSAAYLALAGAGLYVVARGLGVTSVTVGDALAVYGFSLALGLLIPIPIDIGVIELGGLGAFMAFGAGRDVALSAMLVNRLLSMGASLALACLVVALLRSEAPALFKRVGERPTLPTQLTPDPQTTR